MNLIKPVAVTLSAIAGLAVCVYAQDDRQPSTIFRNARPSIVLIVGGDNTGKPTVQGSGFIVASGEVVTNHHVVAGTLLFFRMGRWHL